MLLEGVMTFFLVFVFFATMVDVKGAFNKIAGLGVGLAVTMDALFGYPLTHAALNPARAFGPSIVTHHWSNHGRRNLRPHLPSRSASAVTAAADTCPKVQGVQFAPRSPALLAHFRIHASFIQNLFAPKDV